MFENSDEGVPSTLLAAVDHVTSTDPPILIAERSQVDSTIAKAAVALEPLRALWSERMDPIVRASAGHLHLPLMHALLHITGYPDHSLAAEIVFGLPIHGDFKSVGPVFGPEKRQKWDYVPPEDILQSGPLAGDPIIAKLRAKDFDMDDSYVYDSVIGEVAAGTMSQVCMTSVLHDWKLNWAFTIDQVDKRRRCDDFTQSGMNSAVHFAGSMTMPSASTFVTIARSLAKGYQDYATLNWFNIDHLSAYRQVPLYPPHRNACTIPVKCPDGDVECYVHLTQPFGARASVWNYLRVSCSLAHLSRCLFAIALLNYVDDFSAAEGSHTVKSAYDSALFVNEVIGWRIKYQTDHYSDHHRCSLWFRRPSSAKDVDAPRQGFEVAGDNG